MIKVNMYSIVCSYRVNSVWFCFCVKKNNHNTKSKYSKDCLFVHKNPFTFICTMVSVGCDPSYYGIACNSECSDLCENKMCNHTTGHCFSCITTRFGDFCKNETIITTAGTFKHKILFAPEIQTLTILF